MGYRELFIGNDLFLEVADFYYDRNFGTISKAEMDLLMFKILYRKLEEVGDEGNLRDYELAKGLGITPQKVRSLKERMSLKYPPENEIDWTLKFRNLFRTPAIQYDQERQEFRLFINDCALKNEIENFLDGCSLATEYTLNTRVIILRRSAILAVVHKCSAEGDQNTIEAALEQDTHENRETIRNQIRERTFWSRHGRVIADRTFTLVASIATAVAPLLLAQL